MNAITQQTDSGFFTRAYGAFRWDTHLRSAGKWFLVTMNYEFDKLRGLGVGDTNVACVVDDFGNLVKVAVQ